MLTFYLIVKNNVRDQLRGLLLSSLNLVVWNNRDVSVSHSAVVFNRYLCVYQDCIGMGLYKVKQLGFEEMMDSFVICSVGVLTNFEKI